MKATESPFVRPRSKAIFEALIQSVKPQDSVIIVARRIFKDLWDLHLANAGTQAKALRDELKSVERQVANTLEKILAVSAPTVISAFERQVEKLEMEKFAILERLQNVGQPKSSFDDTLRTAPELLANPWNLWASGTLEDRRIVMKLVFSERPQYSRNDGVRIARLALPFKVLDGLGGDCEMAHPLRHRWAL